jgi:hypothetical protein
MRFLARGRAFSDAEIAALDQQPAVTGTEFALGVRPQPGSHIVAEGVDACPIPGRASKA